MVDETAAAASEHPATADEPKTLMNALVGSVITIVTSPLLPFAAIFGGGVSGYLQRGDLRDGAKVGALSGVIASIPAFLMVWFIVGVLLLGAAPVFALSSVFAVAIFVTVVGYLVGAGAFGGAIGAYLRREL